MKRIYQKKLAVILLCFLMLISALPIETLASMVSDDGEQEELVVSSKAMPSGRYGQSLTVNLNVRNNGDEAVTEVWVSPVVNDKFTSIFEVVTDTFNEKDYGELPADGGYTTRPFTFKIRNDAKTGYYDMEFKVRYKNRYDENSTAIGTVFVKVTGKAEDESEENKNINFVLGEGQDTPYGEYPGVMDFSISLQNKGQFPAYDVSANMVLSEDVTVFPFEISLGSYDRPVGNVNSGATVQLPYSMALREEIKTGYYPLKFNITYREEPDGDLLTAEEVFYVRTKGKKDEEETSSTGELDVNTVEKPRLIISGYTTDPAVVMSGEQFTLTLHMENTSKTIAAQNILFTLEAEAVDGNAVFTPLSGSTAVVFDTMAPGSKVDIVMPMTAKAGVSPKSYTLTVNQKYDVEKLKSIEDKASVAIPVKQVAKLSTGTFEVMPENIEVGSESNVMFGINNTGKITLYNVNVAFEGDSIQKTEDYVGNIEPGATGNVDAMISGIAPTMDDGKIKVTISYEDDAGITESIERDFNLFVSEAMFPDEGEWGEDYPVDMGEIDPAPSFFSKYKIPIIIGGVVAAIAVVIVVITIVKKKRAKKEEEGMLDEIS